MDLWPADKVERLPVDALVAYPKNARTHTDAQVDQVAASIREWGWTVPVLVDEANGIIAGHCRVEAAKRLGLTEVPVVRAEGWTDEQKRAYVLADNKLALNAGWDHELLKLELGELSEAGFDVSLIGFSDAEFASEMGLTNEGEAETGVLGEMQYRIIVDCESERHQSMLLQQFESEGLTCRPLMS